MPITTSAKKALRNSNRKRVFNMRKKDGVQGALKKFKKFVTEKNTKEAQKYLSQVQKTLDKAVKTGFLKKNTASRKKSRLSAMIKKIG
jgi:small subunit ribosomal protein S20